MHADHPANGSAESAKSVPAADPQETPSADRERWITRAEAYVLFGAKERTWTTWERTGKVPSGRWGHAASGKRCKLYSLRELQRLKAEWNRQYDPYPDPDRPGVIRVPVVSGKHKGLEALIDAIDLPLAVGKRWNWSGGRADGSGASVVVPGDGSLARLIMGVADNSALLVSHLNDDRLDCRRQNLVVRTRSQVKRASKRPKKWEGFEPYPDPNRPGIVRVPVLTEKHKGMEALIDAADLPLIEGKRWNWSPGKPDPAKNGSVILATPGTRKPSLPRILLGIEDPQQLVCHLNGDRLDCRRENLVVRTRQQVKWASRKVRVKGGQVSSSRFKGVSRTESGRKWNAAIAVNGKPRQLGRFRSEIDAALAYDAALRELVGDDAGVNLPDPAEVERLRAQEPVVEDGPFPPPGLIDRYEACRMFGVSLTTWVAWERKGRITCGKYHPLPNDKPGRCKLYPTAELERLREEIEQLGKPYPDPDQPGVWRVPLKSYLSHREALIDDADLPVVQGRNWNWSSRTDGTTEGTVVLATTARQEPLHRMILGITDPQMRVSFLNGNALDCRRANLAVRTLSETCHASRKMGTVSGREFSSRFKGVSFDAERGKWVAQIRSGEVGKSIGRFYDEVAAAQAYDDCARVWFGPHAYVNFPDRESTEANRLWAQKVLDGTARKERQRRRWLRSLERTLRQAMGELAPMRSLRPEQIAAGDDGAVLSPKMTRQLFGVTRSEWKRWKRLGWLPKVVNVEGKQRYRCDAIERLLRRCGIVALPYPDPQQVGVHRIPLAGETSGGREALIDSDAVPLVLARRWRFAPSDAGCGGNVQTMNPAENIRLHHVVMGFTGGASDAEIHIGHRNDNPFDCRRENLVVRTLTESAANKRKQATFCGRPCTSRFKGVCWERRRGYWIASIKKDRVKRSLGRFYDEVAAAQAYDEAARELFGEHARLNFPNGVDVWLERRAA